VLARVAEEHGIQASPSASPIAFQPNLWSRQMSNLRAEQMDVVTHPAKSITLRNRSLLMRNRTLISHIVAIVITTGIAGACEQLTANPTGPLPDCKFQPSTELCGHAATRGPQKENQR